MEDAKGIKGSYYHLGISGSGVQGSTALSFWCKNYQQGTNLGRGSCWVSLPATHLHIFSSPVYLILCSFGANLIFTLKIFFL